jgi:hypothetical protein
MKICNLCKIEKSLIEYLSVKTQSGKRIPHHQCNDCRKSEKRRLSGCKPREVVVNLENNTKRCCLCTNWLPFDNFHKDKNNSNGLFAECKSCRVIKSKIRYIKNKEIIKEKVITYYKNNKEKIFKNANRRQKERYKSDSIFVLKRRCRCRTHDALRKKGWTAKRKFVEYIGCSEGEFRQHIENQFTGNMSWEEVYAGNIHIDHHVPLDSAKTVEEIYKLCHYSNLKPMWAVDNIKKSNKLPE